MNKVTFEGINKSFGPEKVLQHLNVEIKEESFTVLLGPSGCGKSTILRLIAGLEKPDSGNILLDGKDCTNVHPGDRNIAMVFQNYALYPSMTVLENIEFGLRNHGIEKEERKRRIASVIDMVGLGDYMKKSHSFFQAAKGKELPSRGQWLKSLQFS